MRTMFLGIDPQHDFMNIPGAALPVLGATDDMDRVIRLLNRRGDRIERIFLTLDTHVKDHIAHGVVWRNEAGEHPDPFTPITHDDVVHRRWFPVDETLLTHALDYTRALYCGGKDPLIIWPEHCIEGTWGHKVYAPLEAACSIWEQKFGHTVTYFKKGMHPRTECYGAFMAEVPIDGAEETMLQTTVIDSFLDMDRIFVFGEASSHCVRATVEQMVHHMGRTNAQKIVLLTDCMSPVAKVGNGPDFPEIARQFFVRMRTRGVKCLTAQEADALS